MKVYELCQCEEYQWQISLGLFASREAIKRKYPEYSATLDGDSDIIVLPEWKNEVNTAFKRTTGYWWYDLPRHGMTVNYDKPMMLAIIERDVIE
jgi:hypothetical protein